MLTIDCGGRSIVSWRNPSLVRTIPDQVVLDPTRLTMPLPTKDCLKTAMISTKWPTLMLNEDVKNEC